MKLDLQIAKATFSEYAAYRLSFVMWRVRVVVGLLVTYFLWSAIFSGRGLLFGYTQSMMLTYILASALTRPFVMGTRTGEVGMIIQNGTLSNFLIRPMSVFRYFFMRDIADKALNLLFAAGEITLLLYILKPDIRLPDAMTLLFFFLALVLGLLLFFYFSLILSTFGFWTMEVWGPRFLSLVVVEFFGGMFFPLDILPGRLYDIARLMPFGYFIYFPSRIFLGTLSEQLLLSGFAVGIAWVLVARWFAGRLWHRGLSVYTAEGK
jgi:ABC-2 type transport system permease protein